MFLHAPSQHVISVSVYDACWYEASLAEVCCLYSKAVLQDCSQGSCCHLPSASSQRGRVLSLCREPVRLGPWLCKPVFILLLRCHLEDFKRGHAVCRESTVGEGLLATPVRAFEAEVGTPQPGGAVR